MMMIRNKQKRGRIGLLFRAVTGFTLIEMLAVMLVIAVLLGIGVNLVKDLGTGKSVTSAVALSEGVFDQARSTAIGTGGLTRVVIHNDPNDDERFRSYLAIAQQGVIDQTTGTFKPVENGEWVVTSSGYKLPGGVFFDLRGSGAVGSNLTPGTMSIRLPGENAAPVSCFFYEYNSEGLIAAPGAGAGYVLFRGSLTPGASEPRPDGGAGTPVDVGGFVVWRQGNTSRIQSASQINY